MSVLLTDTHQFRQAFPALREQSITGNLEHNKPYIYLDSAATSLKPDIVIESTVNYYGSVAGSVHRSRHPEAIKLTQQYEKAREKIANLIGASEQESIIWTKGTTESVNLIANSYGRYHVNPGDEIIISVGEHHANLIPWIMLAETNSAKIIPLPIDQSLAPDINLLEQLINKKTKIIALSQLSNITGAKSDIQKIIKIARKFKNCAVVIDGAQGIVHETIDVKELDIDFYCFSAHKLYGPTGVGVLFAKTERMDEMKPWQGGGKMIAHAKIDGFIPEEPPYCFEAGTPNVAGIIGFSALLDWLTLWDKKSLEAHSQTLADTAHQQLKVLKGYKRISVANSSLLTFTLNGINVNDLEILLAEQKIAVRSGLHCAHPLNKALNISGSIRASFAPYNTFEEVDQFCLAVKNAAELLG